MEKLKRDFFTTDGLTLARNLLGRVMVHHTPYGVVRAMITETEAYMGEPVDEESAGIMQRLREEKKRGNQVLHRKHLADGPGKFCIAMHITKEDNHLDMAVHASKGAGKEEEK